MTPALTAMTEAANKLVAYAERVRETAKEFSPDARRWTERGRGPSVDETASLRSQMKGHLELITSVARTAPPESDGAISLKATELLKKVGALEVLLDPETVSIDLESTVKPAWDLADKCDNLAWDLRDQVNAARTFQQEQDEAFVFVLDSISQLVPHLEERARLIEGLRDDIRSQGFVLLAKEKAIGFGEFLALDVDSIRLMATFARESDGYLPERDRKSYGALVDEIHESATQITLAYQADLKLQESSEDQPAFGESTIGELQSMIERLRGLKEMVDEQTVVPDKPDEKVGRPGIA